MEATCTQPIKSFNRSVYVEYQIVGSHYVTGRGVGESPCDLPSGPMSRMDEYRKRDECDVNVVVGARALLWESALAMWKGAA